jgi:hypothetical protein
MKMATTGACRGEYGTVALLSANRQVQAQTAVFGFSLY